MKLISMTEFVLEIRKNKEKDNIRRFWTCERYAKFLNQPLELWMFVPCDEDGNVWTHSPTEEERIWAEKDSTDAENSYKRKVFAYQQAKERCLFEGFEIKECISALDAEKFIGVTYNGTWCGGWDNFISSRLKENNTVEGLTILKPQLTQTAIKQLGL